MMKRYLKISAYTLLVLILLFILGFIGLVHWFDPNKLKPLLVKYFHDKFHREIRFGKDIRWTFYPHIGVNVSDITITNPENFTEPVFLHIDNAVVGINLVDLIENKKITTTKLDLTGFSLNLIVNQNNQTNWSDFLSKDTQPTSASENTTEANKPGSKAQAESSGFEFKIPQIAITHFNIHYYNQIKNEKFTLTDFSLHATNIGADRNFPLMLSTNVSNTAPQFNTQIKLQSMVFYDSKQETIQLSNLVLGGLLNSLALKSGTSEYGLSGAMQINLRTHKANLKNVLVTFDDLKAIINLVWENEQYQGNLSIPETNLRALLLQLQKNLSSLNPDAFKKVSANLAFNGNKDALSITPISLKLNQATIQGNANITNFNNPTIRFNLNTTGLPLSEYSAQLHGDLDASIKAQATGKDFNTLLSQNEGDIQLQWNDPALHLDVNPAISALISALKKPSANGESTDITFQSLTTIGHLSNGIITTNDLRMIAKNAITTGQGNIDIAKKLINMRLKLQTQNVSDDSKLTYFRDNPLGISIVGPLDSPKVGFDIDALVKGLLQKQVVKLKDQAQKKIEEKVQEKLNDLLGNINL